MNFVLNINELINFFDGKRNGKYSNTIVVLLGEELCAYLFKKYMNEKNVQTEVHNIPCKKKGNKGKQLDRWIKTIENGNRTSLYQTEIKTWNSNGAGGKRLDLNATVQQINSYGLHMWGKRWKEDNSGFLSEHVDKVLHKMDVPDHFGSHPVFPLLLFWEPICNSEKDNIESMIFFEQLVSNVNFSKVKIFCVSIYLRHLSMNGQIKIPLPKEDFPILYDKMSKIKLLLTD
jgi:hypothetical protein